MTEDIYVNRVICDGSLLMDISDTTANESDVLKGKYFYKANGEKVEGSALTGITDVEVDGVSVVSGGVAEINLAGKANASHTHTVSDVTDFPSVFTGTDGTNVGTSGLVPAPTVADANKYLNANGSWENAMTRMVIARYGVSTYAEVLDAYQKGWIIYARASSNSNPATGNQLRLGFLAYVNDMTTPTEFEFQYYRSVSSHTDSQQGDQVYVYKLNKNSGWSVTVRSAFTKLIPSTGLTHTFVNGINATNTVKLKLNSETSLGTIGTTEGLYPVGVDSNGQLCVLISNE